MEPAIFTGLGTAIVTPFHTDESIDSASLKKLVEAQIAGGAEFLVACGSTGEASTLSEDETDEVISIVIEAVAGRIPVIAGCTHNCTREAVRRAQRIATIPGLAGILSANPYYNKPTQQGQYLHFQAIAEAIAPMPLVLYNIPGRTAANLLPDTAVRLAQISNIVGIKESSGNLEQIRELIEKKPAHFAVFAGDDYLAVPIIAAGGAGLISVASNVAPQQVKAVVAAALAGNAEAEAKHVEELNSVLFAEPNPAPAKALLAEMKLIAGDTLRLPMLTVGEGTRTRLREAALTLNLLS